MAHRELTALDSITTQVDSLSGGAVDFMSEEYLDSLVRSAEALKVAEVFGPYSTLAPSVEATAQIVAPMQFISGNIFFELLLLLCFISYTLVLYHFRGEVLSLMSIFRGDVYIGKLLDDQNFVLDFFLRVVIGLGMLIYGLVTIKFVDMYWADLVESVMGLLAGIGAWRGVVVSLGLWLIILLVWSFQTLILRVAATLTPATELIEKIVAMRRFFFALSTIITTPVALIFALSSGMSSQVISIIIAILTLLIVIFIFSRTYKLFMEQKISISYWILYLCGVEVFPLSFLVFFALRNA